MRWSMIRKKDIANGPGIRVSIYVQGCSHHCPGCFNPETWDFNGGKIFNRHILTQFLEFAQPKEIAGFSILGGEPLQQDSDMLMLVKAMKEQYPDKTIWMWTGHVWEELTEAQREIVSHIDVLVDGRFDNSKKVPNLKFRGSTNQRIIDVQATLAEGSIVLHPYMNGVLQ